MANKRSVVDLVSPPRRSDDGHDADASERACKRLRAVSTGSGSSLVPTSVVDLCDSPVDKHAAAPRASLEERTGTGAEPGSLWGEYPINQAPPRWRSVRRRSTGRAPRAGQEPEPTLLRSAEEVTAAAPPALPRLPSLSSLPRGSDLRAGLHGGIGGLARQSAGSGGASHRVNRRASEPQRSVRRGDSRDGRASGMRAEELPLPEQANGGIDADEQLAKRLQEQEERVARTNRLADDARLRRRLAQLEQLDAACEAMGGPPFGAPASGRTWRAAAAGTAAASHRPPHAHAHPPAAGLHDPRNRRGRGLGRWGADRLADAMLSLFAHSMPFGGPRFAGAGGGLHGLPPPASAREAVGGLVAGRLPLHLLFTDRDFNEDDYEMLLALDDGVENRRGASKQEIDSLPTEVVSAAAPTDDTRCSICLEDIEPGVVLRKLNCKHSFHKGCIDRWLQHKACCPICQRSCKHEPVPSTSTLDAWE